MNRFTKFISLILALMMSFSVLVACNNTPPALDPSDSQSESDTEPEISAYDVPIISGGKSDYKVISSEGADSTQAQGSILFREAIYAKMGFFIDFDTDFVHDESEIPEVSKEILVGTTNRKDSIDAKVQLRGDDYLIQYNEATERLVIIGGTPAATTAAVNYTIDNLFNVETQEFIIKSNYSYIYRAQYDVGNISINGTPLAQYVVVIPDKADLYTEYAADNFVNWILEYTGISLDVVDDSNTEKEFEILIGKTNRKESVAAATTTIEDGAFLLKTDGKKVVMLGKNHMVGGAASELAHNYILKNNTGSDVNITTIPTDNQTKKFEFKEAKSAILMIGDGMGFNHIKLALTTKIDNFSANDLPNQGKVITESASVQNGSKSYTDSAAAATALSTGNKTINGYLGVNTVGSKLTNIREYAHSVGCNTGVLTTDVITGATPGGFLVHINSRNKTEEIQAQINELIKNDLIDYCLGSAGKKLPAETEKALYQLSADNSKFFMMIEEGYIDKRSHSNLLEGVKTEVALFNDAVTYAMEFVLMHPDTVLIVTADHETGGIKLGDDGKYAFTSTNHTNVNVGVFAMGSGTEYFNGNTVDNTDIPKFIAKIYGNNTFGK